MAFEEKESDNPDEVGGSPEEIKKKPIPVSKKKEKTKKISVRKRRRLMNMPEPSQQVLRAVTGGFVGVLLVVALTYILWGIITSDSILYAGAMIDYLSMGDGFNALLGVWALSFSPLTTLGALNYTSFYNMIPIITAGLVIGLITKRTSTALMGGLFFIFWGFTIPILFVYVISIFGIGDPAVVDSVLTSILSRPLEKWNYDFLLDLFGGNVFIAWSGAGAIESGLIITIFAIIIGTILQFYTNSNTNQKLRMFAFVDGLFIGLIQLMQNLFFLTLFAITGGLEHTNDPYVQNFLLLFYINIILLIWSVSLFLELLPEKDNKILNIINVIVPIILGLAMIILSFGELFLASLDQFYLISGIIVSAGSIFSIIILIKS